MNFRSIAQLSDQLLSWSHDLPRDFEVVAGVPRSGLLAANILALYLNVPLTDVHGLVGGRCYPSGARRKRATGGLVPDDEYLRSARRVLVLDDSVLGGKAMAHARERIEAAVLPHDISYAAVYVSPRRKDVVDYACELVSAPRVFEWNVFHIGLLSEFFVSFEGIIAASGVQAPADVPTASLHSLQPKIVPSREIGWIISTRPESDRAAVEHWLRAHDIEWRSLVLLGQAGRTTLPGSMALAKAEAYRATNAMLLLEPGLAEAVDVASLSGRPVLCTTTMQLVEPGTLPLLRSQLPRDLHPARFAQFTERVSAATRELAKRTLPAFARDALRRARR
jgi:orotate phosphoribosyltransferase